MLTLLGKQLLKQYIAGTRRIAQDLYAWPDVEQGAAGEAAAPNVVRQELQPPEGLPQLPATMLLDLAVAQKNIRGGAAEELFAKSGHGRRATRIVR